MNERDLERQEGGDLAVLVSEGMERDARRYPRPLKEREEAR